MVYSDIVTFSRSTELIRNHIFYPKLNFFSKIKIIYNVGFSNKTFGNFWGSHVKTNDINVLLSKNYSRYTHFCRGLSISKYDLL